MVNTVQRMAITLCLGSVTFGLLPSAVAEAVPTDADGAIREWFVQRDLAWYGDDAPDSRQEYADSDQVAEQPRKQLEITMRIALEVKDEIGLQASRVETFVNTTRAATPPDCRGAGLAAYQVHAGTRLNWNVADLGYTTMSDPYVVCVKQVRDASGRPRHRIQTVTDVPIPPYEDRDIPGIPTPASLGVTPASTDRVQARAFVGTHGLPSRETVPYGSGTLAEYFFDPNAAADYAVRWSATDPDRYNDDYIRLDNDCTNFVSQALEYGGWPIRGGIDPDDELNWTPDLWGPYGPSKNWSRASWLFVFATENTERAIALGRSYPPDWNNIFTLLKGDLVFADWDPANRPDGAIDHAMIVVGQYKSLGFVEPTISQHTPHRQNVPITIQIKRAAASGKTMEFYPVRTRLFFSE